MQKKKFLCLVWALMTAGLLIAACAQAPKSGGNKPVPPGVAVAIEGTKLKRLTLVEQAAKRIDLQTVPVREEQMVRMQKVGGEVIAPPEGSNRPSGAVLVRLLLSESDLNKVDKTQPGRVLTLDDEDNDQDEGVEAEMDEGPADDDSEEATSALYYAVNGTDHKLTPGQRVLVALALEGGGKRKIIPYNAVLYDPKGDTWVYTNTEPLTFVRHPIVVDYLDGDMAVLSDGPAAGTQVVTVGAAELFGLEFGAGK